MNGKRNGKNLGERHGLAARVIAKLGRPIIRRISELARESLNEPGSWRCLEMIYRNQPAKLLDRVFLSSRSARGARSRLNVLEDEICRAIERRATLRNPVKLISFGSGPGHEVLDCVDHLRTKVVVQGTCVDKERDPLEYGRKLAIQMGLDDCVTYRQGNVLRTDWAIDRYDIGVMSGLIDYFDFETAVSVLDKVRQTLFPAGVVFIANMRRHSLASVMSVLGKWTLVYREPDEVEELLAASGYEQPKVWLEPEGVFCIGMGTKSP